MSIFNYFWSNSKLFKCFYIRFFFSEPLISIFFNLLFYFEFLKNLTKSLLRFFRFWIFSEDRLFDALLLQIVLWIIGLMRAKDIIIFIIFPVSSHELILSIIINEFILTSFFLICGIVTHIWTYCLPYRTLGISGLMILTLLLLFR